MSDYIVEPPTAWEAFWLGWEAGDCETVYKFSLPIAWALGYGEFESLREKRDAAWIACGLDGTSTQYWTQVSANGAAVALYSAVLLEGAGAAGISELGQATSLKHSYVILWNEATVVGTTGTMFPAYYQLSRSGMPLIATQQATSQQMANNRIFAQNNSVIVGQHVNANTQLLSTQIVGTHYNPNLVNRAIVSITPNNFGVAPQFVSPNGRLIYPTGATSDGFLLGIRSKTTLPPGTIFDRYGPPNGKFVSPVDTPFPQRSLPLNSYYDEYHRYQLIRPLEVEEGLAAPWFDQPGGGKQYLLPDKVELLLDDFLEVLFLE